MTQALFNVRVGGSGLLPEPARNDHVSGVVPVAVSCSEYAWFSAPSTRRYGLVMTLMLPTRIGSDCTLVWLAASVTRTSAGNIPIAVGVPDKVKVLAVYTMPGGRED